MGGDSAVRWTGVAGLVDKEGLERFWCEAGQEKLLQVWFWKG